MRKSNSVDPGFGIGVTNALEEEIIFGRQARESSGSSTNAARARQGLGAKPCTQEKSSRQARSPGLQGQAGIARTSGDGKGPTLVCTQPYTEKMPPHRRPYVTLCPGPPQSPAFLHNLPFLMAGGKSPPLQFPGQLRGHSYCQTHSGNEKLTC